MLSIMSFLMKEVNCMKTYPLVRFHDDINSMEKLIFCIIEGTTEKVLQFTMPLKSIYNQNLGFINTRCIFEHHGEVQIRKIY
jgi:hypothetical protein